MSKKFTYYGGIQGGLLPYLTAYWTADNIATDVYVNNLGGAWNSSSHYATGINGEAFDFGNGNQTRYVEVADNDLLSFTDGTNDVPFTISMWVYFYGFSSTGNWLFNKRDNSNNLEYQLLFFQNNGIIFEKFSFGVTANRIDTYTNYIPPFNQWIHLVYTDDGSKFGGKIYANGIDITSSSVETGNYVRMINGNSVTRFGVNSFGGARLDLKHRGMIDELAIFNGTELTQLQVQDLYNGGVGKFYPNI
jgi:hypothetical protein